jgi:predicted permease
MSRLVSWIRRLRNHTRSERITSDTERERTRERDLFRWLDELLGDLRYAARSLRAAPGFTLVAILSLALGIGANTAIFSIIDAVMLKSLPVNHPEQLVALERDGSSTFTNPLWEAVRDRQDVFSHVFAFGTTNFNLTAGGGARRIDASWVSGDYFATLGVRMIAGRPIAPADDRRGCAPVAVLSDAFWQRERGGDPNVIGSTLSLDGHPFQIIGVADPRFYGVTVGAHPQVFVPLCTEAIIRGANSQLDERSSWFLQIVGRPKPGIPTEQVASRFAALAPAIARAAAPLGRTPRATADFVAAPLTIAPAAKGFSDLRVSYEHALYVLMAIVGLVLLIACANVANLLLARAAARQREIAVRLAIGAGRARIARQLVTESLLLSSAGALLGLAFATWGSRVLVGLLSRSGNAVSLDLTIDWRLLAFTIGVATATGLLFGLAPAWRSGRVDPQIALKGHARGVARGHTRFTSAKVLVVAQVALSLVLVVGAGLLLQSWRALATSDAGFEHTNVLLVDSDIRATHIPPDARLAFHQTILERLRAVPGVAAAASSQITPISTSSWNDAVDVDGYTPASRRDALVWSNAVSDGYFATLGVPLLAGRDFDDGDRATSARVAIVSEAFARRFFRSRAVVGRTFRIASPTGAGDPITIVGLVGDTKYRSLRDSVQPIMYSPQSQASADAEFTSFEIRTAGAPARSIPAITDAFRDIDPRITLDFKTLDTQLAESMTLMRTIGTLSGFFGGLALVLATIGLYGIMAYTVARRRNEIGVRIALGAAQRRVMAMVLGEAGRIVTIGVALGLALSFATTRIIAAFLYDTTPGDPTVRLLAALLLVMVGIAAPALPAWRAASVDPVSALRED